jgi:hypothetical protein
MQNNIFEERVEAWAAPDRQTLLVHIHPQFNTLYYQAK